MQQPLRIAPSSSVRQGRIDHRRHLDPAVHHDHLNCSSTSARRPSDRQIKKPLLHSYSSRQSMSRGGKLAPEVNRALFVKNLSFNVTPEELFDLFGKFGPVRQIRQGIANNTKGTAFVVYEDVMDAKSACDKLNGFNFQNRYLVVLYHQPDKMLKAANDLAERQENLEKLKKQHGID
ncbi:RNA-binding domain-containing protein [Clathrospora elynae]|uniref:RNA-binding domain-containing protein n=3 Tax=Pleosporales TaxID=92860 RepID=A0A6A5SJ73_9PLEO|nr:RNA-binding domain-containing protein [Clathrospora elynae]